jgi:hypothetical protein
VRLSPRPLVLERAAFVGERPFRFGHLVVSSKRVDPLLHRQMQRGAILRDTTGQRCNANGHVALLVWM